MAEGTSKLTRVLLSTQTMIGEYLYKYTRKVMGAGISEKRHKRFVSDVSQGTLFLSHPFFQFWIHPYTRTLYWSAKDPASGGASESTSKSSTSYMLSTSANF